MQDKIRIGVLLNDNFHPHGGGGFGYYEAIANAIDDYSFNPLLEFVFISQKEKQEVTFKKEVITFDFEKQIRDLRNQIERVNRIPVRFLRVRLRRMKNLPVSIESRELFNQKFEKWLLQNKIELIYFPIAYQEIKGLNFPFVATHWDIGHYSSYALPELSMTQTFESREYHYDAIHRKALAIFCESDAGKEELVFYKRINPDRIFKVPLFPSGLVEMKLDIAETRELIAKQFSLATKSYYLYPAQFWSHKNHYHLLLAMKKIVDQYPDLKLIFPGSDKGNLDYIKETISGLGIESNVIIPGFITNEELFSLYKNAISLVMPTLLGPTNMPLLEAAMLGCPVITTDFKGHRELLGDHATYINPLDENDIAAAMESAYQNKDTPKKEFINTLHTILSAVKHIESNFLTIRKIRKTFGMNYMQF